ncbi:MAG TPA: hypothetical protein VGN60_07535 [Devosia sp.]|jgi:hypothetical protein|nr:hypothetical protein [Devosia sp.]
MGLSPREVDRQSLWQFLAAWNGYVAANTPENGKLTESEAEALFDWIDEGPAEDGCTLPLVVWDGGRCRLLPA